MTLTPEAEAFLAEWENSDDTILAHTSGSTGTPKEIRLPKADMRVSARATNRRFGLTASSLLVCPLSAGYIAGKMMLVRALEADCSLIFEPPSNHPLQRHYGATIDLLPVVPSQCAALLENPLAARVRNVIVGGAPMSRGLETRLQDAPFAAFATYGMTETCSHVALRQPGSRDYTAMPGVAFATDHRDCLKIIAPDYTFGTLQTNDVVRLHTPSTFEWLGRYDNVINTGGVKFEVEPLEEILAEEISEPFYLVGVPDEKWGQRVVLRIETGSEAVDPQAVSEILEFCKKRFPRYAVPKEITPIVHFARTPSGKVIRK